MVRELLGRPLALVLRPQPLRVPREALVDPDVLPAGHGHAVAVPLVGQLVDHDGDVGAVRELARAVERPGLRLQRVPGGRVRHVPAERAERVRPEVLRQPVGDLAGALDARPRRPVVVAQVLAVRVDDRDAAVRGARRDVEPPDGQRGQVGGLRSVRAPGEAGPAALRGPRLQRAVGDRLRPLRHGHRHVVGGLVQRMVVAREPPPRRLGLVRGDPAVRGAVPAGEPVRRLRRRHPAVAHHDGDVRALGQRRPGRDLQLVLARGGERRLRAVHPHLAHVQQEVQVEPRQVLCGAGQQGRRALQLVRRRPVGQPQVVVGDVVPAVAVGRVVGVADARRAGRGGGRRCRDRQQQGGRERARDDQSAVHGSSKS